MKKSNIGGAALGFAGGLVAGLVVVGLGDSSPTPTRLSGYDVDLTGPIRVTKIAPSVSETVLQPHFIARGSEDRLRAGTGPTLDADVLYTVTFTGTKKPVAVLCKVVRSAP